MNGLTARVVSAVVAVLFLFAIAYFFQAMGLIALTTLAIFISVYEYSQIAFGPLKPPQSFIFLFWLCCSIIFIALGFSDEWNLVALGCVNCIFFSVAMWITRGRMSNETLLPALAMGSLGFLYAVSLPTFAVRTLLLPYGIQWFFALCVIVFAGDIAAYFSGSLLGKHKLMPAVSPKKSIEGAVGGALGSVLSGVLFAAAFLPHIPKLWMAALCLVVAFVAQSGDLFASLVKRVAQVKDSGHIMPGHGGLLDRLDGIFFSAPVIYAFVRFLV